MLQERADSTKDLKKGNELIIIGGNGKENGGDEPFDCAGERKGTEKGKRDGIDRRMWEGRGAKANN